MLKEKYIMETLVYGIVTDFNYASNICQCSD